MNAIDNVNKKLDELNKEIANIQLYKDKYLASKIKLNDSLDAIVKTLEDLGMKDVSYNDSCELNHYSQMRDYGNPKENVMRYRFNVSYRTYKAYENAEKRLDLIKKEFDERFHHRIRLLCSAYVFTINNPSKHIEILIQ